MVSAWEEWKKKNAEKQRQGRVSPVDFLNPDTDYADQKTSDERYQTCLDCEELVPVTHQCRKCGCFMRAKTKLLHAVCPLAKW